MSLRIPCGLLLVTIANGLLPASGYAGQVVPDDPKVYSETRSLGDLLNSRISRPIHIIYVHGMAATGRYNAEPFLQALSKHLISTKQLQSTALSNPETRQLLQYEQRPTEATINGVTVWRSEEEWKASKPFVDRYTFHRANLPDVVVDDVNWWPLLFALKCRFVTAPETDLSGVDKEHLQLCARSDFPYYPWLSDSEVHTLLESKPNAGRGAWLNTAVKRSIMNWGLSDAAMAMGPMRAYFRKTMDEAYQFATQIADPRSSNQEFVVISASLGSFVVLDALIGDHNPTADAHKVATQTPLLYFFANQWALLDLARIQGLPQQLQIEEFGRSARESPVNLLQAWVGASEIGAEVTIPKQIIAYSDPSDILSYRVPKIPGALVVNLYDRNEIRWFGLFANPLKAHAGHVKNDDVLKSMFTLHRSIEAAGMQR